MKKLMLGLMLFIGLILISGCSENYSNGERIGLVTQFSKSGLIWKTHEGHLNMTQTGMNSSTPFDFSIDRDNEPAGVIPTLEASAQYGWKVKITYHETMGWNWFHNRGETSHFVTSCEVLDKNPIGSAFGNTNKVENQSDISGKVIDTIYVIIVDKSRLKY